MSTDTYYNLFANKAGNVSEHLRRSGFETVEQAQEYAKNDAIVVKHGGRIVRVTTSRKVVSVIKAIEA